MTVYFVLSAFLCCGFFLWDEHFLKMQPKRRRFCQNVFLLVAAAAFVLVATFRYGIGYDYFNYQNLYEQLGAMPVSELLKEHVAQEFLGYSLFTRLLYLLGLSYRQLLFVVNILLTAAVFWFLIRYSPLPWMGAYLYLTLQFFAHSMNLFRQSIAATVCLLAYPFLKKRRLIPFVLVVVFAASFHTSALFFLPFYWVLNWKVSGKKFVVLAAIALPVYLFSTQAAQFLTQYVFPNYAGYIGSRYWSGLGARYVIYPAIYFAAVFLMRKPLLKKDSSNRQLINSSFYVLLLYVFSTHHMILERFSIYLFMYAMILIPKMIECLLPAKQPAAQTEGGEEHEKQQRKQRQKEKQRYREQQATAWVAVFAVVGYGFCYLLFAAAQGSNGFHKVYPYVSVWSQTEQEEK